MLPVCYSEYPMTHSYSTSPAEARLETLWTWFGFVTWILVTVFLVSLYAERMHSSSIDVGVHAALVSRLMQSWQLPAVDPYLAEMATYPNVSHLLASILGQQFDSAITGMQVVAYFSVLLLWGAIGASLVRLPRCTFACASIGLAVFLVANRLWLGLEIFGSELVGTYYFAHFVAQAISICALVAALGLEYSKPDSRTPHLVLGLTAPVLASVHLLPSFEVLGTLGILVLLELASRRKEVRQWGFGAAVLLTGAALTFINPDTMSMIRVSVNNGTVRLHYLEGVKDLALLAMSVGILSLLMLSVWWRSRDRSDNYAGYLHKYFGAFGLSVSAFCLSQILLYVAFGKGSEYACFKYAIGLQSLLALDVVLLLSSVARCPQRRTDRGPRALFPAALVALACICTFPLSGFFSTQGIVDAERDARQFFKPESNSPIPQHDLALGIRGIGDFGDYLVSRIALGAPPVGEAFTALLGSPPKDARGIDRIVTSRNSVPWDVEACRKAISGDLIALDASCVFASFGDLKCTDTIEFVSRGPLDNALTGFALPDQDGRWSEGPNATLTCEISDASIHVAHFGTVALVNDSHAQTMIVSVNGGEPMNIEYSSENPSRLVSIPLAVRGASELRFTFSFPHAISPLELGINGDDRKLSVKFHDLRFE